MKWILLSFLVVPAISWAGNTLPEIASRCLAPHPGDPVLYSDDFKWGYEMSEMLSKATDIYSSPKRLSRRAYWDPKKKSVVLPYGDDQGGPIPIHPEFIQAVARHIERAFEKDYIDAVFFPDMGHSHLLVPEKIMKEKYDSYPSSQYSKMYENFFQDHDIKILYHTAEQLKMIDENRQPLPDPRIQWRLHTRNIVGLNSPQSDLELAQNPESPVNTSNGLPGYFWWGAGFNLSANQKGCFEFHRNGKTYFFDISMYDLEPRPE